ncbi:hypothetical protein EK599_13620 [Vibrio sp. T187]|uniref:hypothetical protein n=1 Tax=Vibrio TaxID=662 RepID=UPI0010CA162C|nr:MULTISPECIES: hypothetical protein [Vibrio]MBW3696736.1 hypothetical protein [Vibrio sp. T187]
MDRSLIDKINESEMFHKNQVWAHSGMAALSYAFFLAYLSSISNLEPLVSLNIATILFALSLGLNSVFMAINVVFGFDRIFLAKLRKIEVFNYVTWLAYLSFLLATSSLVAVFSWWAALVFIVSLPFGIWLFIYVRNLARKVN